MEKVKKIFLNSVPILLMVSLIPLITNDFILTLAFLLIIGISFAVKKTRNEWTIFTTGFLLMIIFEYLFVSTGVELFRRNSLLGIMPIWLPFLWAYGFVAISRAVKILEQ